MADRIPAYDPGPRPTATRSMAPGDRAVAAIVRSIKPTPVPARVLSWTHCAKIRNSWPMPSLRATERRFVENSSARIFISDNSLGLAEDGKRNNSDVLGDG